MQRFRSFLFGLLLIGTPLAVLGQAGSLKPEVLQPTTPGDCVEIGPQGGAQLQDSGADCGGGGGGAVSSVFARTGHVVAATGDYSVGQVTGAAPLASPALTGTPTAPTAAQGDASTKIATTAYADRSFSATEPGAVPSGSGGASTNYLGGDAAWHSLPSAGETPAEVLLCTVVASSASSISLSSASSPSCAIGSTYNAYHIHTDGLQGGNFGLQLGTTSISGCDTGAHYQSAAGYGIPANAFAGNIGGTGNSSFVVTTALGDSSSGTDIDVYVTNTGGVQTSFSKMHYVAAYTNENILYYERGVGLWGNTGSATGAVTFICLVSASANMTGNVTVYGLTH